VTLRTVEASVSAAYVTFGRYGCKCVVLRNYCIFVIVIVQRG